jgi:hypothetical protein
MGKNLIFNKAFMCFSHYWPSSEGKANTAKETFHTYAVKGFLPLEIKIDFKHRNSFTTACVCHTHKVFPL